MPKDYARKSRVTNATYANNTKRYRGLWFLIGFLTGILSCVTLYIMPWQLASQVSVALKPKIEKTAKVKKFVETKPVEKPQFDFYRMLPQMGTADPAEDESILPEKPLNASASYLLQVASFSQSSEAERMKAQLLLAGFDANVQLFVNENKTWSRVLIGPFEDVKLAREQQEKLKHEKIDSLLITQPLEQEATG
jgi:cell division protein FtsN